MGLDSYSSMYVLLDLHDRSPFTGGRSCNWNCYGFSNINNMSSGIQMSFFWLTLLMLLIQLAQSFHNKIFKKLRPAFSVNSLQHLYNQTVENNRPVTKDNTSRDI